MFEINSGGNNINKEDTIVILQERMAGYLMYNSFHKITEKKDLKNSNRNIYIFRDTKELRECMSNYQRINKEIKK